MWKEKKEKRNISMLNKEIVNLINEQIWLEKSCLILLFRFIHKI